MTSENDLKYPRVPFALGVEEWPGFDVQFVPLSEDDLDEHGLYPVYVETTHGIVCFEMAPALLHKMFAAQIEDKSGQLHETDPIAWLSIAMGPLLDRIENFIGEIKCDVMLDQDEGDEAEFFDQPLTGYIDRYADDDGETPEESHAFRLWMTDAAWEVLAPFVRHLAVDTTDERMPVTVTLLGGHLSLTKDSAANLSAGDFVPLKQTWLNSGDGVLVSNYCPPIPVTIGDTSLSLSDTADPHVPVAGSQLPMTLYLGEVQTTIGALEALTELGDPLPFEDSIGQDVQIIHNTTCIAMGALWQLSDVLGLRIKGISKHG